MEMIILTALIAGMVAAVFSYIFIKKFTKKKHWSQGYIVLGKEFKKEEKVPEQQNSGSLFPPGW